MFTPTTINVNAVRIHLFKGNEFFIHILHLKVVIWVHKQDELYILSACRAQTNKLRHIQS